MMNNWNAAHSNFLALAGLEWGVISNGGHMNVFNTDKLIEWEYNSSNQLIGDVFVAKSDYGSMYTTMKANGWIGQFNHPAQSGQFNVGGTDFGYTADGDQVMVLCEIMNSSGILQRDGRVAGRGSTCRRVQQAARGRLPRRVLVRPDKRIARTGVRATAIAQACCCRRGRR